MRKWIVIFVSLLTPAMVSQTVSADESSLESALRWFDTMDIDRSGTLTEDELINAQRVLFARSDANQDGEVTVDEYIFGIPSDRSDVRARTIKRFQAIDEDGDEKATEDEFIDFAQRVIAASDSDKNGTTSRDEFAQAVQQ